jgi:hypothetical protein
MADLNHQIRGRLLIARRCHQRLDGSRRHPESPASAGRVRRYIAPAMPNNRTTGALSRSGVALRHAAHHSGTGTTPAVVTYLGGARAVQAAVNGAAAPDDPN